MSKKRVMAAAAFKAQCLAVLDRVANTGEAVIVTKRGRPVAQVTPVKAPATQSLKGSARTRGDIVRPILGDWPIGE